ncbi:MAG: hypothetical protein FWE11_00780 [Defluviitaleaceae bacterium]|nr:hypothetical protein [Defluviitaleaceae bacterium]
MICPRCKRKIPPGKSHCHYCKNRFNKTTERKVPIITAAIALVFFAALVFGSALAILSNLRIESDSDMALHLDGIWEIEELTFNDEHITYIFDGDLFTSITKAIIYDATPDDIDNIREFHLAYSGAMVETENTGDGNYRLIITSEGSFSLDGSSIVLAMRDGIYNWLSFYWDDDGIIINGDRFLQQ